MTVGDAPGLDELSRALADLPALGDWVDDAACGDFGAGADVFTADHPDPAELAVAERVCRRCPVLAECRAYAASVPVWGVWGGRWHGRKGKAAEAA